MSTPNLALNQPAYNSSAWNTPLNANETILDNQMAGTTSIALTNANVTLSGPATDGSGQTQAMRITLTGAISANITITIPSGIAGQWIVYNTTSGAYTITIASGGGGSTVVAAQGYNTSIYSDGTNVKKADDWFLASGTVSSFSGGSTGLTPSSATTGAVTLAGTLAVANGGTGAATLNANNVLLGNGTGALQVVAPSTSGNVLTSNGTTWVSQASSAISIGTTWTNYTSSRSLNTTYTNTTGKPIFVSIYLQVNGGASVASLTVAGSVIANNNLGGGSGGFTIFAAIPSGATYSAGGASISSWYECV